ncbi:MAG TPA: phosphate ABC transporter ATP-binding protein [Baekduia sp.]|uniref:ABC transporter ATP-binding protein n=1 Tax=Baekduia sp. TaxID=2600305 RepID=UPI002C3D516B|nr:phosphate ABC transporter ATP-binding protein [Baekduia sp.]HMJ33406.1 phosphate ABC transporter ATP-binding protein [Baekduia sp.]
MSLFDLESVTVAGVLRPRLHDVSVSVPTDGITVLQGPSGSGKSTLLRLLNRLEAPDAGSVRYRGEDLAARDVLAHRREVGMVFQAPVLFPGTVADNLAVARPQDPPAALLERAGLPAEFLARDAGTLSGGEAQRACLARALGTRPRVLLMDEPTSALDPAASRLIEQLARSLAADGVPIVLVSHDREQARRLGDRIIDLDEGRVLAA